MAGVSVLVICHKPEPRQLHTIHFIVTIIGDERC